MSLLEDALATRRRVPRTTHKPSKEHLELALAVINKEVTFRGAAKVLKFNKPQSVYPWIFAQIRYGLDNKYLTACNHDIHIVEIKHDRYRIKCRKCGKNYYINKKVETEQPYEYIKADQRV